LGPLTFAKELWGSLRLYFNSPWLCLFRFGQYQPEDAIFHGSADFALIDTVGNGEMADSSGEFIFSMRSNILSAF
jgi:hypothetical protein